MERWIRRPNFVRKVFLHQCRPRFGIQEGCRRSCSRYGRNDKGNKTVPQWAQVSQPGTLWSARLRHSQTAFGDAFHVRLPSGWSALAKPDGSRSRRRVMLDWLEDIAALETTRSSASTLLSSLLVRCWTSARFALRACASISSVTSASSAQSVIQCCKTWETTSWSTLSTITQRRTSLSNVSQ